MSLLPTIPSPISITGQDRSHRSTRARDLNIDVYDNCNCCCIKWKRRKLQPNTLIYINERGEVVKFDPRKADDEREALRTSISNLLSILAIMADERQKDRESILEEIEGRITPLRKDDPQPLTLDMVRQIRMIFDRMSERRPETDLPVVVYKKKKKKHHTSRSPGTEPADSPRGI